MKTQKKLWVVAVVALALVPSTPAFAVSKEIIQLQTQVQALQDQMARMQQSFDERMGVMRNLVEQNTDGMNKIVAAMTDLQKSLQQQHTDVAGRNDQVSGQIQALNDSIDELKGRMAKISTQLDQFANQQQNLPSQAAPASGMPGAQSTPQSQAPPPEVLYNNALRDYNAGKYDLASGEFSDFLKYYPTNDLAGNAQFYTADIEYRQGNFQQAVKDYDKVLEQYPGGNKASAAQLRKGLALLQLGDKQAGTRELQSLIQRYPRSIEATTARDQLRKLGVTANAKPSAAKRKP
ncbi:MAG TPA: tetratricopeptide repeat protein [Terriglobales bacterium]|jgi:tol-pal system protein YbgF|nr:tetratricopeptide repeat protein [Terriglobales bacterium]